MIRLLKKAALIIAEPALQAVSDVPFLWMAKRLAAGARWCRATRFRLDYVPNSTRSEDPHG